MTNPAPIVRVCLAFMAAIVLAACDARAGVEIAGLQTGVSRQQYLAMPDSARIEHEKDNDGSWGQAQGVAVDVVLKIHGYKGSTLPLAYTLHDARSELPFVSRKVPVTPDAARWSKRGRVWLPVLSPGSYYVQVVLGDSTGRKTDGPRTEDFTVQ